MMQCICEKIYYWINWIYSLVLIVSSEFVEIINEKAIFIEKHTSFIMMIIGFCSLIMNLYKEFKIKKENKK